MRQHPLKIFGITLIVSNLFVCAVLLSIGVLPYMNASLILIGFILYLYARSEEL